MKRLLCLLLPFYIVLLLSCNKSSDDNETPPPFNTSTNSLIIDGHAGDIDSFTINYTDKWTLIINPATATWLKVSSTSSNDGDITGLQGKEDAWLITIKD